MATFTLDHTRISAIAAAVPRQVEHNSDLTLMPPKERDYLIKTTGVAHRHIVPEGTTTADLCYAAADKLLNEQQINRDDIGLLIFVSQSPDYYLPASAALLQERLKLPITTLAFDINLGCSGYIYGLTTISSLMKTTGAKKALLLAGDTSSVTCSREDKSTYPLFGDAGTATLLEAAPQATWYANTYTDGSGGDAIMVRDGQSRHRLNDDSFVMHNEGDGITRCRLNLVLKGDEVFAFSIKRAPESIRALVKHYQLDMNDIDHFVMHQANKLMNDTIRKLLRVPEEKVPYSLDDYGNTSSASIPLTLVARLAESLKQPQTLLLSGFGVGLSWGNIWMPNSRIHCLPLIEV